jgi:mannose-1-phosphate guanylyltransferase
MRAMVLAAGVGSRLEPLTNQVPKPMVPIANRPVMQHILALLRKHGITEVVSNLHYQADKIQEYFGDGSKFGMKLKFLLEEELTGDAGGVRACKDFFGNETFIVMMGDLLTDADLTKIVREHKEKKALASIAIKRMDDVTQFGVVVTDKNGFITGFQEKPKKEEALSNHISTGIYILEPKVFDYIPTTGTYGFGRQLFPSLVQQGLPVLGVAIDDYYWSDVGTIGQYRQANFDALKGNVKVEVAGRPHDHGLVEENASIATDAKLEGMIYLGRNSKVEANVVIKGAVLIGDDCVIESGAELEDTIVWSGTRIGRGSKLTNCVLGSDCAVQAGTTQKEVASVSLTPTL